MDKIEGVISKIDIISTATSSPDPLVFGDQLTSGQHLDLLKAIKPSWKEADERAIIDSSVFVV